MLDKLQQTLTNALKDEIARAGIDKRSNLYRTAEVEVKQVNDDTVDVSWILEDYATFVDRGRRPGRRPPVDKILEWVKEKGLSSGDDLQLAWAISTAISKRGLKPRPFIQSFTERQEDIISAYIDQLIDSILEVA